jgi:hypothetical protein
MRVTKQPILPSYYHHLKYNNELAGLRNMHIITTVEHLLLACETMKELKIGQNKTKGGNRLGVKYDSKGKKCDGEN